MTRRFWMVAALLVAACATLPTRPTTPLVMGTIVIDAQTLPQTRTFAVDPIPDPCLAADPTAVPCPIISYTFQLDAGTPQTVSTPSVSVTFTTGGKHVVTAFGTNFIGNGPSLTQNVLLNVPGSPKNPKLQ